MPIKRKRPSPLVNGLRYRSTARYFVTIPGMQTLSLEGCTFDGKVLGIERDPGSYVALVMPRGEGHLPFLQAVFYANCLAYEHDSPTLPDPTPATRVR